jgi:hypothetical protein
MRLDRFITRSWKHIVLRGGSEMSSFETLKSQLSLDASGGLSLGGQAMILMPRHFFLYIMEEVEAVAGEGALARIYQKAGFDGAVTFCNKYGEAHQTSPEQTVRAYLREMSLRGWGRYEIVRLDPETGHLEVLLCHSALEHARIRGSRHEVWVAAMEGAMSYLLERCGRPRALRGSEVPRQAGDPPDAHRLHVEPAEKNA